MWHVSHILITPSTNYYHKSPLIPSQPPSCCVTKPEGFLGQLQHDTHGSNRPLPCFSFLVKNLILHFKASHQSPVPYLARVLSQSTTKI